MGITIGQETVTIERRYTQILIDKRTMPNGETTVNVSMTYEDGFYDDDGSWKAIDRGQVFISGDAVRYLMGLTGSDLGATTGAVGELIDRLAYGVLTDQIRTSATLTLNVTDDQGNPVTDGFANVYDRNGRLVLSPQFGETVTVPIMFGAKVSVIADGFEPFEQTVDLIGDVTLDVQLTPISTTSSDSTTDSGTNG